MLKNERKISLLFFHTARLTLIREFILMVLELGVALNVDDERMNGAVIAC